MDKKDPTEASRKTGANAENKINLLEYFLVIVKNKKMILMMCLGTLVVTCGITLLMPNIYVSTVRILPPQESSSNLSSMLGNMEGLASLAGISSGNSSGALYVGMLKSRTIADKIVDQFDLMTVYDQEYRVEMYEELGKVVSVSLGGDDGIIAISVEDENPEQAAQIVNAYVGELKKLNVKINLNSASRERLFLKDRLSKVTTELHEAEENLKNFQEKSEAISLDDQARMSIEAIATLRGNLALQEVELAVLLSSQTEQSPQVKEIREGIAQLKNQVVLLERSPKGATVEDDIFLPTSAVPELGIRYARLLRALKIQEKLYELLTQQYEMAKITEAKNISTIQVLDHGVVADKKSKPNRGLIVILATFSAGFLAVLYAFIREYGKRMLDEDRRIWREIKQAIKIRTGLKL